MDKIMRLICIAGAVATISGAAACAPIRYDHDLVGQVIEADNGEPIPDTVILREWIKRHITVAGDMALFMKPEKQLLMKMANFKFQV
jgi:hypothetical protein